MNTITRAIAATILVVATSFAAAQETAALNSPEGNLTGRVGEVLLVFLVLSIAFEVALTPIFNWRIFLAHFEGRGFKTPITVILAFFVFWSYQLDIVRDLLVALGYQARLSLGGQFLTALLIAGGSDGVFRIFTKLGIRNPQERKEKADAARANLTQKSNTTVNPDIAGRATTDPNQSNIS
jgi:hypothetical protein